MAVSPEGVPSQSSRLALAPREFRQYGTYQIVMCTSAQQREQPCDGFAIGTGRGQAEDAPSAIGLALQAMLRCQSGGGAARLLPHFWIERGRPQRHVGAIPQGHLHLSG